MSGASKRSHEESGHSSSKYGHDDIPPYPRLMSTVSNDYQSSHDVSQDKRMGKIPRTEPRDTERRSPMHSVYRMPPALDGSHSDHPVSSVSRLEPRDLKDNRDFRTENRELKVENRDLYTEAKRDTQNSKTDKDGKFEFRGDENKKTKHDGESQTDPKSDSRVEKDGYGSGSGYMNWKESKEYHRGKRYSEPPSGSIDPWHIARNNTHESAKDDTVMVHRGYGEAHEAVGENRVDSRTDDKLKDKDRKRKDVRLRDWGEKDKERSDNRRSNFPVSSSTGEGKDIIREQKEAERWDRERKEPTKDNERVKEREKDHSRRETWVGPEKVVLQSEKDSTDTSARVIEQENAASELKKHKDYDGRKNAEKEGKNLKKERETNLEGEKIEKHNKETNEGCADGEVPEREREVFNYDGVQQRKRMPRPRGSPQTASREPRLRSHVQDNEGSQGKAEVSSVVYKVGESMQELIKLWKEYESSQTDKNGESSHSEYLQELIKLWKKYESSQTDKNGGSSHGGPTLEIRIPAEHVTATNRQVRGGQLWGTDIYTYDSDLVAVLMHTGYCRPTASPPPSAIQELRATIQVLPPLECYISTLRNNVRSRAWGAAIGCSYRVDRCCIVKRGGGTIDLEPCITHTSTVEPTLAPVAVERTMTTRAAASNALRQQRFVREVTIQYNLCNEPWIKYSLSIVADKGLKKQLFTSARLKKGEVLYLETHSCRYELCFTGEKMVKGQVSESMVNEAAEAEKSQNHHPNSSMNNGERRENDNVVVDVFRWSKCKKPLPQKTMRSIGIPLPLEYLEVLEENIEWEDVEWSQTGVWIAGKEYSLARVHFLSPN